MLIKPTVGRIVLFKTRNGTGVQAAIIAYVHDNDTINLCVFNEFGVPYPHQNVALWDGEGDRPDGEYAEWMPYQKSVAAGEIAATQHAR